MKVSALGKIFRILQNLDDDDRKVILQSLQEADVGTLYRFLTLGDESETANAIREEFLEREEYR